MSTSTQPIDHENLCVICKDSNPDRDLTGGGAIRLITNLKLFEEHNLLQSPLEVNLKERLLNSDDESAVITRLSSGHRYHKGCYDRFNQSKLKRILDRKRKISEIQEIGEASGSVTRSQQPTTIPLGTLICFHCKGPDTMCNRNKDRGEALHAAASQKGKPSAYVNEFTARLKQMASFMQDSHVLSLLHNDVRASELYYHLKCHSSYITRYNTKLLKAEELDDTSPHTFAEFVALNSVQQFIDDSSEMSFNLPVLEKIYLQKFEDMGVHHAHSHSSRFARKLMSSDLNVNVVQTDSGSDYKVIKNDSLQSIISNSDWTKLLVKAVKPIRKEILSSRKTSSKAPLSDLKVTDGLADNSRKKLKLLITLICLGVPSYENLPLHLEQVCQTISFNTRSKTTAVNQGLLSPRKKHGSSEEPIQAYVTLKLFSTIRSKDLIQQLFHLGYSHSYTSTLNCITELSTSMKDLFLRSDNKVLPSKLRKGVFTVFSDDNVDHNSTSSTATRNFHASAVTAMQFQHHPDEGDTRKRRKIADIDPSAPGMNVAMDQYSKVEPVILVKNYRRPVETAATYMDLNLKKELEELFGAKLNEEDEWLKDVCVKIQSNDQPSSIESWTSYHASKSRDKSAVPPTIICGMPCIDNVSHAPELQAHLMRIAVSYTEYLNPLQTAAVGSSDLPLYALKKVIQWAFPQEFTDRYFPFMGGLHIEMASLNCIGQLIKGTGVDTIIIMADLDITGLQTAVCDANNIKKARYGLQVLAVCLSILQQSAYRVKLNEDDNLTFKDWVAGETSVMFRFWNFVLTCIKTHLMFVRSFREADFYMFISSLEHIMPLFFSLDHFHYARWGSVFVQDLYELKKRNPVLFDEFKAGSFAVNTAGTEFSKIAYDHAMEQRIIIIKSTAGYTDVVNNEENRFFRSLELALPEIKDFLSAVEGDAATRKHKETMQSFKDTFTDHVRKVNKGILTNPFSQVQFTKLNCAETFPTAVASDSEKILDLGEKQYREFKLSRFIRCEEDVDSTIKKNALNLPSTANKVKLQSPRVSLGKTVITKLREACRDRETETQNIFKTEFTGVPEALCAKESGVIYKNTKSQILSDVAKVIDRSSGSGGLVVDLSVMIRSQAAVVKKDITFLEFILDILVKIGRLGHSLGATRIDMVADMYFELSIKSTTRISRGSSDSFQAVFSEEDTIPDPKLLSKNFLASEENKTALNIMVCKIARENDWGWDREFCITYGRKVWASFGIDHELELYQDMSMLEEADNRIVCHVMDLLKSGRSTVTVRTVDSDVVTILLGFYTQFMEINPKTNVLVDFGTGDNRKIYSISESYCELGKEIADGVMMFHAFSGCDSCSAFFRQTKSTMLKTWRSFEKSKELSDAFRDLSFCPSLELVEKHLPLIESYLCHTYGSKQIIELDRFRFDRFRFSTSDDLRELPPCSDALREHLKRAAYQAGWLWGNALEQQACPPVDHWGWLIDDNKLFIKWKTLDCGQELTKAIGICSCRTNRCLSCSCATRKVKCLIFCKCKRSCTNPY